MGAELNPLYNIVMRLWIPASALALLVIGCGGPSVQQDGNKTTINTPEGKVEVTNNNDKDNTSMSVTTDKGTATFDTKEQVDITKYGLKAYPSTLDNKDDAGGMVITTPEGEQATMIYWTKDDPAKVFEFYGSQLTADKSEVKDANGGMVAGKTSTGASAVIMIQKEDAGTRIGMRLRGIGAVVGPAVAAHGDHAALVASLFAGFRPVFRHDHASQSR